MVEARVLSDSEIVSQLEALVADCLQVVSYKWLSLKFSIPANRAKRLLQNIADKNTTGVQVVYAVSGWTDLQQRNYSVQLVSKAKLEEAKQSLVGSTSYHVYSLQPCLPKDSAELWSTDFVQATELFNQPPDIDNCFRDNRLSGVSNDCVTRSRNGKRPPQTAASAAPAPPAVSFQGKKSVPIAQPGLAGNTNDHGGQEQKAAAQVAASLDTPILPPGGAAVTAETTAASYETAASKKASTAKQQPTGPSKPPPAAALPVGKRKAPGAAGGQGGSLANLWGRAKPKREIAAVPERAAPQQPSAVRDDTEAAAAHVQALEVKNESTSDDDDAVDFASLRGRAKRRHRHVIMQDDSSDDDQDPPEGAISLSSPGAHVPPTHEGKGSVAGENGLLAKQEHVEESANSGRHQQGGEEVILESQSKTSHHAVPKVAQEEDLLKDEVLDVEMDNIESGNCGGQLLMVFQGRSEVSDEDKEKPAEDASTHKGDLKKRRLMKKTMDERGREVYEAASDQPLEKPAAAPAPTKQPSARNERVLQSRQNLSTAPAQMQHKAKSTASVTAQQPKTNPKLSGKNGGKSDAKLPQQGNLLSFFKRK